MTKRLNRIILALLVLIGLPYYWLLIDNRPGDVQPKPLEITRLRELARAVPGSAPTAVELELVAFGRVPGTLFAAGSGLKRRLIGVMAFRLPVPGQGPILIDSGMRASDARTLLMEQFNAPQQQAVDQALRSASAIVATHEHVDHLTGVLALNDPKLLDRVWFNAAQLPGKPLTKELPWPTGAPPVARISGTDPIAIAPGVVVIPAPSHTPGSQMVFVQLVDGREFLFAGDIASLAQNWQDLRARSRLIGDWLAPEQRGEVYAWLKTMQALSAQAPQLVIVPGHDFEWIDHHTNKRGIRAGFSE